MNIRRTTTYRVSSVIQTSQIDEVLFLLLLPGWRVDVDLFVPTAKTARLYWFIILHIDDLVLDVDSSGLVSASLVLNFVDGCVFEHTFNFARWRSSCLISA
jgi:hypothetical protein